MSRIVVWFLDQFRKVSDCLTGKLFGSKYLEPFPTLSNIMISQPWQEERTRIPSNEKFGAAIMLFISTFCARGCWFKPTCIGPKDGKAAKAHREYLRDCYPPKVPRARVVSGPEPRITKHACEAAPPENEVAFIFTTLEATKPFIGSLVEIVRV